MDAYWRLASEMLRYKGTLVLAMLCALLSGSGVAVGLAALSPIVKILQDDERQTSLVQILEEHNATEPAIAIPQWVVDVAPAEPYHGVILLLATLAAWTFVGGTGNFLHQYLSMTVSVRALTRIRQRAFHHIVHMPLGRVVERGPAQMVARIVKDTSELDRGFRALTNKSIPKIINGLIAFAVAILFSWEVALTAPLLGIALGIVLKKLGKRIRRGQRASLKAHESLLRITTEAVQGLRAVKANTAERSSASRFHRENMVNMREQMKVRTARSLSGPLAEIIGSIMIGGLTWFFAKQIFDGRLTFDQVVVALTSLAVAGACFKPLAGIVNEMYAASAPAKRIVDIFDEDRERRRTDGYSILPRHSRSIEFDHISFTYPGAEGPSLSDVTLRVNHGERVAIVGPNGCGKTTLLSMVPCLLRPTSGRVLIDGVDIESVALRSLRGQIGVVTQETVMFRGPIAANIAFGLTDVTREQVIEAAKQAHAHEFIERLSNGYDADVLEQGASLSGGQRQRIAIARAILREPSILILDEATSQIDAESEQHINEAIADFCDGRTALVIAHRLSTVLSADRIVVMDEGRVVDQGVHDELLERCDLYRRLAEHQLSG